MTPGTPFQSFLDTIRCWLRKATDAEVDALHALVSAERTRRARPRAAQGPVAPDQPQPTDASSRDRPPGR